MLQNGKTLSMHNNAVYKGDYTHNGTLLKLHENSYTIGYSALLTPNGKACGVIGVTGNPSEVKSIAMIVKMSMETMLEYELEKEQK